jgi:hypothetical protein
MIKAINLEIVENSELIQSAKSVLCLKMMHPPKLISQAPAHEIKSILYASLGQSNLAGATATWPRILRHQLCATSAFRFLR